MMYYKSTQAARKGIMSQTAINELSREHCGAGVGTLTMVVVGALVLGVALTVLSGCGYTPPPRLTDGLDVRYLPLHLCEVPAIIYVAPGTPEWQAEFLRAGVNYWNEDTGMNLFSWGGVLPDKGRVAVSYTSEGVHIPIILAGFADGEEVDDGTGRHAIAAPRTSRRGCMEAGVIWIDRRFIMYPVQVEQLMAHELGHMLGLAHAQYSMLMSEVMPAVKRTIFRPADGVVTDAGYWIPEFALSASTAEIDAVRGMYGREVRK